MFACVRTVSYEGGEGEGEKGMCMCMCVHVSLPIIIRGHQHFECDFVMNI